MFTLFQMITLFSDEGYTATHSHSCGKASESGIEFGKDTCKKTKRFGYEETECFCFTDFCNSSTILQPTALLTVLFLQLYLIGINQHRKISLTNNNSYRGLFTWSNENDRMNMTDKLLIWRKVLKPINFNLLNINKI